MKKLRLLFFSFLAFMAISVTLKAQTVVDIVVESENHQTLEAALTAAELVDTLQTAGPFTVFAPTDAAFDALPEGTLDALLDDPSGDLTDILLHHVVADSVVSGDLSDEQVVETMLGQNITVTISDEGVFINDAQVTTADIEAENGVVHVIDVVLMPSADVEIKETESLGNILTDENGYTLYFFAEDAQDTSACVGDCLDNWPVFYAEDMELGEGLDSADFETIDRGEGVMQTTYKGWPLYYFADDTVPGLMLGEGVIEKWFVAKPDYTIMLIEHQLTGLDSINYKADYTQGDTLIQYFTDDMGVTLYTWTNDNYKVNNFTEPDFSNNENWPIYEEDNIVIPSIYDESDFGVTNVYGRNQLTFKGWPLYYFGQDSMMRGSNKGVSQPTPGIWPVPVAEMTEAPKVETVVDIVTGSEDYSILVDALTRDDLTVNFADTLSGTGPFTVFAPTNDAFEALFVELGVDSLEDIEAATLEAVLLNHVIAAKVMSSDLTEGLTAETLLGEELTFSIEDSATVTDPNGRMSNIIFVDLEAENGVVHVIDTVLRSDMRPETVVDIASDDDNFSTLVEALSRDDLETDFLDQLTGEGPFTVFAPTNEAFEALFTELGVDSLEDISAGVLDSVLRMHVLEGRVLSSDLSEGMTAETLLEQELTFSIEDSATVTDPNDRVSNITEVDLEAQNGVVHAIDTVLLYDMRPETVVDIATDDDNFSTLVEALTRDDLTTDFMELLTGEGPFTVFAPTNAAFDALFIELGVDSLDEIDAATLDSVLLMHVVQGRVMAEDLSDSMTALTMLDQVLTFSIEDSVWITDPAGRVSNITDVDQVAQNGVVHAIDTVLLFGMQPETVVDIVVANNNFSTLEEALTRADLTIDFIDVLQGEGPFTVFAPTNAAFEALFDELNVASLDEIDAATLEKVLQMHVLSSEVMSADLSEGLTAETILEQELTFSLADGATITDPNGRVINITDVDIEAQNGVIHVVDTVILHDLATSNELDVAKRSFEFYPNPATTYITVETESEESTLRIIDLSGKIMLMKEMVQPVQRIDLNGMRPGVYFITVKSENTFVTQKLLIQR